MPNDEHDAHGHDAKECNITCIGASMGGDPAPPAGQGGEDKNGGEVGELAIARRAN